MSNITLEEKIQFLKFKNIIEDDDYTDIEKINDVDKALINTAYDVANKKLKVLNIDENGKWIGYLHESYEEAMKRQENEDIIDQSHSILDQYLND